MAKKHKAVKTVDFKPTAVVEAENKKEKLQAVVADRDKKREEKAEARKAEKAEVKTRPLKNFTWGNDESAEKFVTILEAVAGDQIEVTAVKNPTKMLVILATNMTGEAITYRELASRANAWMHDSFAVSPTSQALDQLSDERPIKAFNGRNEIWKMQKGTSPICIIKGEVASNHSTDSSRESLENFNLIDEAYEALTPELIDKLKAKFKR